MLKVKYVGIGGMGMDHKCYEDKEGNIFFKEYYRDIFYTGAYRNKYGDIYGEPWFVATDVCKILDIKNTTDALKKGLEDFERARFNLGRQGEANIISESGFYTLVLRSRKNIAKPFRIWVTRDVLPTIRKTGKYIAPTENKVETMLSDMECNMKIVYAQINNMEEIIECQNEILNKVVENMTLTTVQQGSLQRAVKDRVNHLLGGAHSPEYKKHSRLYFINIWNGLKEHFNCGSRWQDLNPKYYNEALDYILQWEYTE